MFETKKRFIFLLSHPIQYFTPLFVEIAKEPGIDLLVLYCSDENVNGHIDKGFGVEVKWDVPLLEGYNYKFLKNNAWKPSIFNGFFGLINIEIFRELKKERGSYLVIHGWAYFTNILAILAGKLSGVKLCLRAENPLNQELLKPKFILAVRKIFFRYIFFKMFDYFLYVGIQNKKLYEYYGVKQAKLIFTPYAVDNQRFKNEFIKYKDKKTELRKELGLPLDKIIILTSGKYNSQKRPIDLLTAYKLLDNENIALMFLGEGILREKMEEYIAKNSLKDVYLTGFKNQSEVGKYFACTDIFVLPSGLHETWGLVVNEAMVFGLPVIVSDIVGSSYDLVSNNVNGYRFIAGDINDLKTKLGLLLNNPKLSEFGLNSQKMIANNSFEKIIAGLKNV